VKKLLLSTAALLGLTLTAGAADLPRRTVAPMVSPIVAVPVFTWTGFYVGVHAGYSFGEADIRTSGNAANTIANVGALARPPSLSFDQDGFMGGAQIGYNMQFGMFVAGIEADISYTDLSTTQSYFSPTTFGAALAGTRSTFSQDLEYLGTVRARLGVAFGRALVYATGGLAYGDVSYRADFFTSGGALQFNGSKSGVEVGYTLGAGVEYAFTNNLTLKAEYLYYDLGSQNVVVNAIPGVGLNSYTSRFETEGHIGRVGLNYKF
jgi:outer membrane immunogenic protein